MGGFSNTFLNLFSDINYLDDVYGILDFGNVSIRLSRVLNSLYLANIVK